MTRVRAGTGLLSGNLNGRREAVRRGGKADPRVATALLLWITFAITGCGGAAGEPEFFVSRFDSWNVPAAGRFLPAPRGLFSDEDDNVFVLDDAGRVLVYDSKGQLQKQWEMPDHTAGKPEGIWELQDGSIAVADTHYHRVVIFDADGNVLRMFGSEGNQAGQFVFPVSIAEDPHGDLYVGEYGDKQRIQKFRVDGTWLMEFGRHGEGDGEFQRPSGMAWHGDEIFVVDAFNNRIQVFGSDGRFRRVIKLPDNSDPLSYPYDLRLTGDDRLYVIENRSARLTVLRPDGTIIGRYGRPGRGLHQFYQPWDLTVLTDGRVLVADTGNHRLVELTP
jgi:sugar lactone lactonase YvrE